MPAQKRQKDRSRSSFFRAEIAESFQPARNLTMLSLVTWEMNLTPVWSAKATSLESRTFCLAIVASVRCLAAMSSRNLLTASSTLTRAD